ncbi:hypothetical protein WPS_26730 [Vulcanimicrobium alpinum]|uniref:Isochorismatase-like domain-containing protein n=1 Tax=Vulcanimicrobium alpinum TaxID=3016050 RepID=A0AAN1XXV0_UNVUL|nr:isochorismatase family protein [Vulcanimicrobium alpinum]BDE07397.1 hypothetical protein WPS_26730 [Vulcanimicrobium alpinum]
MNAIRDLLLVVDAQPSRIGATMTRSAEQFEAAIGALVEAARMHGIPILVTAGALGERRAPLAAALAGEPVVWRSTVDAFAAPEVALALEGSGRWNVAIAGAASDIGVAIAARSARARGFNARWIPDACAATSTLAEIATVVSLAAEGIPAVPLGATIAGWQGDFAAEHGARTLELLAVPR